MNERLEALAAALAAAGIRCAFGITGSGPSLRLIAALAGHGVKYFPVAHEAAAALAAGACFEVSGVPGVAISIKGPGLANLVPGIATCAGEGRACLTVSEAYAPGATPHRKHKRMDHAALLAGLPKAVGTLACDVRALLGRACAEVPGPVHLEIHEGTPGPLTGTPARLADPAQVLRRVEAAQRPVIVAGALSRRRDWGRALAAAQCPVFTTAAAKGVLDEALPQAAGVFTGDGRDLAPESSLFAGADLVLGLGLRDTEVLTPKPFPAPLVLLDEAEGDWSAGFAAEATVRPAPEAALRSALDACGRRAWGADRVGAAREALRRELLSHPWSPAAAFEALNQVPWAHTLVADTGTFCTVAEHLWRASPERPFVGSSILRSMGTALPTALGVAAASHGRPVICACGDGGIGMYLAEFRLALEERLPLCLLLLADGVYGSIAAGAPALADAAGRRAVTVGRTWDAAIAGMGIPSRRVGDPAALRAELARWDRTGPLFLEAWFDAGFTRTMASRIR